MITPILPSVSATMCRNTPVRDQEIPLQLAALKANGAFQRCFAKKNFKN